MKYSGMIAAKTGAENQLRQFFVITDISTRIFVYVKQVTCPSKASINHPLSGWS